jgi:2-oxo-4-hydroxy-4-carboxy-5-ureidoimidazoline decarboxylase
MDLQTFNSADRTEVLELAAACAPIPRWCGALADARPYAGAEDLLRGAAALAATWTNAEVDAALARHPRIGERIEAEGVEAGFSRREQAGAGTDADSAAAWLAANREYEDRFDRIFLIRAAGRTQEEMLAQLRERLGNDPAAEARIRAGQLAEIALLRLKAQVAPNSAP